MPLEIDPDVAVAETLPADLYVDPAVLPRERERIFGRTWQLVGRADQVKATGDFFTAEIGLEPIVVVRDGDALRGYFNVCKHRAGPVARGCGSRKTLQCRYHGWTYSLGGRLLHAPEMEGVAGFTPADVHLTEVRVEAWGPLVFANVDPSAPPLSAFLEDIPERAARHGVAGMKWVMRREYEIACNWKLYVENYLEGYHVPVVHPGLYKELDYDAYRVDTRRYHSYQHAPLRPVDGASPGTPNTRRYVADAPDAEIDYFWIFPNVMLNVYFGQLQTNVIVPLSHDRTLTIFEWYATQPPETDDERARWASLSAFSDEIQAEDIAICEAVQKNLRSRSYHRGRYSVKRENGVHHFHALVAEYLT
jgi:choline monooxygenase